MMTNEIRQVQLRSGQSRCESFVRFINKTNRNVDVIWINYEGQRVKYQTLQPEQFCDANTFVSHPWVFRDSSSQAKLMASCKEVFQPQFWRHTLAPSAQRPVGTLKPRRTIISITLPVYSLKERCLEVVRQCLTRSEDANRLDIPRALQEELRHPLT